MISTVTLSPWTRLKAHIAIARIDHWVKNVFVLPGLVIPLTIGLSTLEVSWRKTLIGLLAVCIIASSNYVINEILDGPLDRLHPIKRNRPVPSGLVHLPTAYAEWIVLMVIGLGLAWTVSYSFLVVMAVFWIMGCIYNIPPVRTKDVTYLDVMTESINNPLRLLAGWYMVTDALVPPLSLIVSYWMGGCYFMALKRFSEYREFNDPTLAAAYRRSFRHYTERSLLVSVVFYASTAMLFFGAFIIRYRIELALSFPFVAFVMSSYCNLAFEEHSAVQNPEYLYRQKELMIATVLCAVVMVALLWIDMPQLLRFLTPTLPTAR